MARHRRSGIGAGIEGWMGADRYERELMLRQKRQEASIGHEKQALGFDERRVRLAEQAGEREQQLFPSRLRTQEAGAGSAEITTEEQRREEDLARRLDALESAQASEISPTIPPGAPAGAAARLEPYIGFEERTQKLEEESQRRKAERAEGLPGLRTRKEAIGAEVQIAGGEALLKEGVPAEEAVTVKAEQKARQEVAGFTPEKMEADLAAIRSGTALQVAQEERIRLLMPGEAKLLAAKLLVADEDEKGVIKKYMEERGMDYGKFVVNSALSKAGMILSVDKIYDNIRLIETAMLRVKAAPSMDDPAVQELLAGNPMLSLFIDPAVDKEEALAGLEGLKRNMKRMLGDWGVSYEEIIEPSEKSAAAAELRKSRESRGGTQ